MEAQGSLTALVYVRTIIQQHKEDPKGVVSCLENSEGVTAVRVRVSHPPPK